MASSFQSSNADSRSKRGARSTLVGRLVAWGARARNYIYLRLWLIGGRAGAVISASCKALRAVGPKVFKLFKSRGSTSERPQQQALSRRFSLEPRDLVLILPGIMLALTGVMLLFSPRHAIYVGALFLLASGSFLVAVGYWVLKARRILEGLLLRIEARVALVPKRSGTGGDMKVSEVNSPFSSATLASLEGLDPKKILYH